MNSEDFINSLPDTEDPEDIYGGFRQDMARVMGAVKDDLAAFRSDMMDRDLDDPIDHVLFRIKDEDSMREKLAREGLPVTVRAALTDVHDAIGMRVICPFISDIYEVRNYIAGRRDLEIIEEKDNIKEPEENGYRGYLMILRAEGRYYIEFQIRTIPMNTWASLEHSMRYKRDIGGNTEPIEEELKQCSKVLASTEESLQTIRYMIQQVSC